MSEIRTGDRVQMIYLLKRQPSAVDTGTVVHVRDRALSGSYAVVSWDRGGQSNPKLADLRKVAP